MQKCYGIDGSGPIGVFRLAETVGRRFVSGEPPGDGRAVLAELVAPYGPDGQREETDGETDGGRAEEQVLFGFRVGVGLELDQADYEQSDAHEQRNDDDVQKWEFSVAAVVCDHLFGRQRLPHLSGRDARRENGRGARRRRRERHRRQVARRHDAGNGRRRIAAAYPLPVLLY